MTARGVSGRWIGISDKRIWKKDARNGQLWAVWRAAYVMDRLRPPYWFSAHLAAVCCSHSNHENWTNIWFYSCKLNGVAVEEATKKNSDEIDLDG